MKPSDVFQGWPGLNQRKERCKLSGSADFMTMVFFSKDRLEIQQLSQELTAASIPCEIREALCETHEASSLSEAQLWIQDNRDLHRAFSLCVERAIGFAKRKPKAPEIAEPAQAIAA